MQIHTLKLKQKRKAKKTIGRGGKKGTYCGKGMKGQKARSGAKINPLFEGGRSTLVDHMKKVRGFRSPHAKKVIVKFQDISKKFKSGDTITIGKLVEAGLVKKIDVKRGVKVLNASSGKEKFSFDKDISLSGAK